MIMSKALVIKGANFSTNKLDTVVIGDPVPCTSISVSPQTASLTAVGATAQLTATALPADTTDSVTWTSSDSTVATVSSSGLVTCIGLGSATITATCGSYSATCTVTAAISIDANTELTHIDGYMNSSTELPTKDYAGVYATDRGRIYTNPTNDLGGYKAINSQYDTFDGCYPIPLPENVTAIKFTYPETFYRIIVAVLDSTSANTYSTGYTSAKATYYTGVVSAVGTYTLDLSEVTGDSFIFSFQTPGTAASGVTGDVTVEFE